MRASELIGTHAFDETDRFAGVVRDVRLDPDRAADGSFRVLGLVLSDPGARAAAAHSWGFAAGRADGPALLKRLVGSAAGRTRFVPVDWVLDWNPDRLKIGGAVDEPR
jgi:hypothetical protein